MTPIAHFRLFLFTLVVCLMTSFGMVLAQSSRLSPPPKDIDLRQESVTLQGVELSLDEAVRTKFGAAMVAIEQALGGQRAGGIPVRARIYSNADTVPPKVQTALSKGEAYWVEITKNAVTVIGADALGVLHGLTTLEKLVQIGKGAVLQGSILDWPNLKLRGLHLELGGKDPKSPGVPPEAIRDLIVKARRMQYNTLIFGLALTIRFPSMSRIVRDDAWTMQEFLDVVRFARENGLEVIPEIKTLTQQKKLLRDVYPHLMYNKSTYDPRKEETYAVVLPMLDEVIHAMQPKALHIGHDEVAGHGPKSAQKWLGPGESMLPPEFFFQDVSRLHAHLQKRGVETWMWGDMLIAPEEFPGMRSKHMHAATNNYAALRPKLPKDIVIVDWHYADKQTDFPSALALKQAGYRVLGATKAQEAAIRNFSRYIARIGGEGMIATTYRATVGRQWDVVDRTIRTSGEAYWGTR